MALRGGGSMRRAAAEERKPCAAMVAAQCIYAAMALWAKAVFVRGVSPAIFVVYRQAGHRQPRPRPHRHLVANRTKLTTVTRSLGTTGCFLVFVAALFGATSSKNLLFQGLHLGSSSMHGDGHGQFDTRHHLPNGSLSRVT